MQTNPGKAVQAEIVSYLMQQVMTAPPARREALFGAVKSALNIWISGGRDMRTQAARTAADTGFGSFFRGQMALMARHSVRSGEWLRLFEALHHAFEREARAVPSEADEAGA